MNYEDTKRLMMTAYPKLFVDEVDVLHHLFFVNGNGYDWIGGELTDGMESDVVLKEAAGCRARHNRETTATFTKLGIPFDELIDSGDPEVECAKERAYRLESAKGPRSSYFLRPDGSTGRTMYPLCEYADILHVPPDVRLDWLRAAREALRLARTDAFRLNDGDEAWLVKAEAHLTTFPAEVTP